MIDKQTKKLTQSSVIPFIGYLITISLFVLGYLLPDARIWGVNFAFFLSVESLVLLIALTILVPVVIWFFSRSISSYDSNSDSLFTRFSITTSIIFLTIGYFLRPKTFFLGDGYTLLSNLATENPLIKFREIGESYAHYAFAKILPASTETAALLSYQIISFLAGMLTLMVLTYYSRRLFSDTISRIIFWLGVATGGYMILFFGYVENYSLLCMAVTLFVLMGIHIAKGNSNKWLILFPTGLIILFHSIGVAVIPGATYLLISSGRSGTVFPRVSKTLKLSLLIITIGLVLAGFIYFYQNNFFFRLAFIPLIASEITAEGYTLFSKNHLNDLINLVLMLLPGLLVLITAVLYRDKSEDGSNRVNRFLTITSVSCLSIVFLLDPRLGMPRDWDLFAFAGLPIVIMWYYYLVTKVKSRIVQIRIGMLAISLGLFSLLGRSFVLADTDSGIAQMKSYIALDKIKNRNGQALLVIYYQNEGNARMAQNEEYLRHQLYPQIKLVDSTKLLLENGYHTQAYPILKRVIVDDPLYWNAWINLGSYYLSKKQYDSAQITSNISMGLNPYNLEAISQTAYSHYYLKQHDEAEQLWLKVLDKDSEHDGALVGMANVSYARKNKSDYFNYLTRAASKPDALMEVVAQLGYSFVKEKDYKRAAELLRLALSKGLDTSKVTTLFSKHPQLAKELPDLVRADNDDK